MLSSQSYDYQISGKLLSPAVRKTPTDKQTTGWELIETFILRAWCVGLQVHILYFRRGFSLIRSAGKDKEKDF